MHNAFYSINAEQPMNNDNNTTTITMLTYMYDLNINTTSHINKWGCIDLAKTTFIEPSFFSVVYLCVFIRQQAVNTKKNKRKILHPSAEGRGAPVQWHMKMFCYTTKWIISYSSTCLSTDLMLDNRIVLDVFTWLLFFWSATDNSWGRSCPLYHCSWMVSRQRKTCTPMGNFSSVVMNWWSGPPMRSV